MRARFPLSAKILLWFFANLALIAIASAIFLEFEFHLGPESLIGGRAGHRVEAIADLINGEIRNQPVANWTDILTRAGALYNLQLLIVAPDGHQLAGANITLPQDVEARIFRPHPPGPDDPDHFRGPHPDDLLQPPPDRSAPPDPNRPPPPPRPREHRMFHTDSPSLYWLLVPMDVPGAIAGLPEPPRDDRDRRPRPPLTLIAVSESIGLGGLVFDITPWLAAIGSILLFSLLFWLPLVRGITRSIREMTGATARVAEGHFDVRVRDTRADELGQLARSINQMSGRLSGFVNGQKRFLGDIAHELCSPLARAQMALGIMERQLPAATLDDLREEIQQMSALVNELLSFSKASLAAGRIQLDNLSLLEEVTRAMQREALAPSSVTLSIADGLYVKAEPGLLCRAISNLLRNAVKYAGHAGPVEVSAEAKGRDILLIIADHGPGVPADSIDQLFDPFYRVDVSRARETGGTGLGLAIVKTCVESCGGRVACRNRDPHGLIVTITLPAA